jgi:hypothetical protein
MFNVWEKAVLEAPEREKAVMSSLRFGGSLRGLLLAALGLAVVACAGKPASPPLPPYSPEEAQLFDDTFAPPLFGFDPEARVLASDPKVRERTRQADFVVPARVETVSRVGGVEHRGAYEVILAPSGPPLVGAYTGGPLTVSIPSSNPSYAWFEGAGASWVGTRVVVFGRRYASGDGAEFHFRCEPDTQELRAIVERDAPLRVVR